MKRLFYLPLILLATGAGCLQCNRNKEEPGITKDELSGHLSFLATDSLKGRFPGTPEDSVAALYLANEFRKAGLRLYNSTGLQAFRITTEQSYGPYNRFTIGDLQARCEADFAPFPFSASDSLDAEVVFVGYGFDIADGHTSWNDYQDMDVTGKWVMILRGHPEPDSSESVYANYGADRDKAMIAKDKGAAGVLFVSGEGYDTDDQLVSLEQREFSVGIPVLHIKRPLADRVLGSSGKNISELEQCLTMERKPCSLETGSRIQARSDLDLVKKTSYNVVGFLDGSDPQLKEEYLVLGAHYDHLGMGGPGTSSRQPDTVAVHYGADDNASGVADVIEIAEKLALKKPSPAVSCIFIAFGAEEMGLLGSKYFLEHSPVPVEDYRMMVNLDMVGRLEGKSLQLGGTGTARETEAILDKVLATDSISVVRSPEGSGPSDHASFYAKDIPVLFVTSGPHSDYHKPSDNIEKIDLDGMQVIAELVYKIMMHVGNLDTGLTFTEAGPKVRSPGRYARNMQTLDIMPDFMNSDDYEGMRVDMVTPGGRAALGGIKKGDCIVAIEDKEVNNIYDYMFRMSHVNPGQQIVVRVKRGEEYLDLLIQL
jgi:aminopeptidase YwaD